MEVRTTDGNTVTDTSVRAARAAYARERSAKRSPLARIADTAARALGSPLACLYISDPVSAVDESCHGTGAESLRPFLDEIVPGLSIDRVVLVPHYESNYPVRGDGAAVRSGVAVPVRVDGVPVGILCIADYRDRDFEGDVALVESFAELAEMEVLRRREAVHRRDSDERLRAITENAVDLAGIVDHRGTFTYLSPAAGAIFGRSSEEMLGHTIYEGVLEDDLPALRTSLASCAQQAGDAFEMEYRYVHPAGALRHLRVRGRNLPDRPGVGGIVVNIRDVTDRIEFEEEIIKSRDRAEEMSRLKSVFLTNMSHEIRTPLTTILGFAEILDDEVGEEQKEFVQLIRQGGERLMDTLMSILDLARLESSSFDINLEWFGASRPKSRGCR